MPVYNSKSKGFTILELIVAMAIIAVLATLGVAGISIVQRSARDAERRAVIEQIAALMEEFRGANGRYPEVVGRVSSSNLTQLRICATSACTSSRIIELKGSAVLFSTNPTSGLSTPEGTVYCFTRTANGAAYSIGASLESGGAHRIEIGNATPCSFTTNAI
ncbi:MAG: type II secretion system GspH family protein [Candidatus Dojkabacteria bacterium]|nr:type II secretion system GspH family protein [Candidatus Dojkabacteria bacterium]